MALSTINDITGVILAGGKGRRMGGLDKGLVELDGRPLIAHVIDRLRPQVGALLINANRNTEEYRRFGFLVTEDELEDYQGPLAGFAAALRSADTDYILTVPCDGPFFPENLAKRLLSALKDNKAELAVAHDGERMQPVYALIPRALSPSLTEFLNRGERKIDRWYAIHKTALADFSDAPNSFFNINSSADMLKHNV